MLLKVQWVQDGRLYVAGVHVKEGIVTTVPPVLEDFKGMGVRDFLHFAKVSGWRVTRLDKDDPVIGQFNREPE